MTTSEPTDPRAEILRAFCDTIVPRIERADDPDGFWARTASDIGVDVGVADLIAGLTAEEQEGLGTLLTALDEAGLRTAPTQLSREQILRNASLASSQAATGIAALTSMTLFLAYGAPDPETGRNPNWSAFRYPGPVTPPREVPKPIEPLVPEGEAVTLEADVCIVGSGAGGATIAGTLAERGLRVCVLEAGPYRNESDFRQLEFLAYQEMFWRGGPTPTAEGNVSMQAGTALGGGTVINWTNCLRTKPWVREQWAQEFGLDGVDGPDYDAHLDAVLERIGATDDCSDLNGTQRMMRDGAERLGWNFRTIIRNADPASYTPDSAAYMGFGDQSGSKRSADKTWLMDAADAGADILVHTRAQRVLVEGGRAAGVEAVYDDGAGRRARVTVRAPRVVVACGALESPALLTRSGIGGDAVGDHLRLHPCAAVFGVYGEELRAWWGPPQAGLCDEFDDTGDGYGFLVESGQYTPGLTGSAIPWTGGAAHKQLMTDVPYGGAFIALTRDRGHGRVDVDASGESVVSYSIDDELDQRNLRHGLEVMARIHEAAGARSIHALATGMPTWRRGEDLDGFIARAQRIPMRAGGHKLFSAHQMGTCRMGADPATSVANPWGELHDTPGVWIGDGSAFPTPSGTNPMVSIMTLARRTAGAIADDAGARDAGTAATAAAATN